MTHTIPVMTTLMMTILTDDDDETLYETVCPSCNNVIALSESILEKGEMPCPCCGEMLEFDYSDLDGDTFEVPIDDPTEDGSAE